MQKTDTMKRAYATVMHVLYNLREIQRLVDEARQEPYSGGHSGGSAGHAFVSDPTANAAIRAADELQSVRLNDGFVVRRPETWLEVVRQVYAGVPSFERDVMQTYFSGCDRIATSEQYHISEATVYFYRGELLASMVAAACQAGLVYVIDLRDKH